MFRICIPGGGGNYSRALFFSYVAFYFQKNGHEVWTLRVSDRKGLAPLTSNGAIASDFKVFYSEAGL